MKTNILSISLWFATLFTAVAQPVITESGVFDDFSTANDYTDGNSTRGIYWWNTDGVNSVSHDTANNQLMVHATQAEYQYVPFGVGFGSTSGQPNTIDLSNDGKWSFDITNYGTEALFIRVACQDNQQRLIDCTTIPNPNNLAFDNLEVWAYQVQILVPVGQKVTFKSGTPNGAGKGYLNNCDFNRGAWGYYGTWDPNSQTHIGAEVRYTCDMSKIQGISITPMNAAKNTTDYHALALTNGIFGISNFKVGSTAIALGNSDNSLSQEITIFPNPAKNFVTIRNTSSASSEESIQISNLLGQTIYSGSFYNKDLSIDTHAFMSGIYMVKVGNVKRTLVIE